MKRYPITRSMALVAALMILAGCNVPRIIWPQKDMELIQINDPSNRDRVLIASRSTEFKDALVKRIQGYYEGKPVYVKVIGLDAISGEKPQDYSCVVLINTCIAWGLDPKAMHFIDRNPYYYDFIVLTTSEEGSWKPRIKNEEVDTISAASVMTNVDEKSREVVTRIDAILKENSRLFKG